MYRNITSLLLLGFTLLACSPSVEEPPALEGPGEPSPEELQTQADIVEQLDDAKPAEQYTYDQFLDINIGDTVEEVQALLGQQGESLNSWTQDDGFGEFDFKDYFFSSATAETVIGIVTIDGTVVAKDQMGIGVAEENNITLEQFDQIQPGQTMAEVEAIYGAPLGNLVSVNQPNPQDDDVDTFFYAYELYISGHSARILFQGGVVIDKSK